jgi:hypothetical protein
MMEALMRDRGLNMTPMGSIEREDSGSDVFRGDPAFPMPPLDPINPALAFMEQSSLFSQDAPNPTRSPVPVSGAPFGSAPPHLIHMGSRTMPFPGPAEYQQYLLSFFTDIHLSHPCIDEAKFRRRSERVLTNNVIQLEENQFLALNYAIFACCDVLLNVTPADTNTPAGWRWSEIVDDLLDKKSLLSGSGDLTLIQCVLFQVRLMFSMIPRTSPFQSRHWLWQALYYTFVDMPGLAYNTIGAAGRLVFQYSLHQQSTWTNITIFQAYERICVFWNVFTADRFISIACRRPYTIHEADIEVELPAELFDRVSGITETVDSLYAS